MTGTNEKPCPGCGTSVPIDTGANLDPPWRERLLRYYEDLAPLCDQCVAEEAAQAKAEARAQAEEKARHLYRSRLQRSGLPESRHTATFEGFSNPAAVEAARACAEQRLPALWLPGSVGVGKTQLAAAVLLEWLKRVPADWVKVTDLLRHLRASFDNPLYERALALAGGTGPIVLDDLDRANPTGHAREVLYDIVDGRIEAGAPLVVTSNAGPSELGRNLGDAVKSRLVGYCRVVRMTGPDRRLELARRRAA